jgi:hypothetical protein
MDGPAYTPGPWIAQPELLTPGGLHVAGRSPSVRAGNHIVASVNRFLDQRLNETTCAEAEVNARLIAMCPTMFEYISKQADRDLEAGKIIAQIFPK